MLKSSNRRFRLILLPILTLLTVVLTGVGTIQADGMTGDPPIERPTGTTTSTSTSASTMDLIDLALLLLVVL